MYLFLLTLLCMSLCGADAQEIGGPLRRDIATSDLNIHDGEIITERSRMRTDASVSQEHGRCYEFIRTFAAACAFDRMIACCKKREPSKAAGTAAHAG